MLSEEKPSNPATVAAYRATLDEIAARSLASRLVKFEHNPDPREAPDPAKGIRIRKIVPYRVVVDRSCQDHNLAVYTLGREGEYTR